MELVVLYPTMPAEPVTHFEDLFAADAEARRLAGGLIEEVGVA